MVAAATTSLPERAEEGRNYDYRYVWIRDQCYAGEAAARAGALAIMDDSVRFVTARLAEHGRELRPAYTGRGTAIPETHRPRARGIPGRHRRRRQPGQRAVPARHLRRDPVAVGRRRAGTITSTPTAGAPRSSPPRPCSRGGASPTPASGSSTRRVRWTHSRLICAAGLRAIAAHAPTAARGPLAGRGGRDRRGDQPPARCTHRVAGNARPMIRASTRRCCWPGCAAPSRRMTRGRSRPARRSSVTSPRICTATATVPTSATSARRRARSCCAASGWRSHSSSKAGRCRRRAGSSATAPPAARPGLLSEEFDVTQRQMRGNLPQAFAHALLLECAATLRGEP